MRRLLLLCAVFVASASTQDRALQAQAEKPGEWACCGGDESFDRYSPLSLINQDNVKDLEIVWRRPGLDPSLKEKFPDLSPSHYYKATPIMADGIIYAPDAVGLLEAIHPETGRTIWVQQPFEPTMKEASGQSMRGIDSWRPETLALVAYILQCNGFPAGKAQLGNADDLDKIRFKAKK